MEQPEILWFDKATDAVSYRGMRSSKFPDAHFRTALLPVAAVVLVSLTGCIRTLSPLAKHTAAFSAATAIIVNNSEDAYRSAIRLHQEEQVAKAVEAYGVDPSWTPYTATTPLLTADQLDARIKVLDALKAYADELAFVTDRKKEFNQLGDATAAAGESLKSVSSTSQVAKLFPGAAGMSAVETNGISTAMLAMGDFLIQRKLRKSLPAVTQAMNGNVQSLCKLIDSDVTILRRQADRDYTTLITDSNQLIQTPQIDPVLKRQEIRRLIDLAQEQKANDMLLEKLRKAVTTLAYTHQALAAAVQGNNPESVKQHVVELVQAGQDLGTYYKSLPN